MKLTNPEVKKLPAPEKGNRITYDDTVRGFGVRITAAGARAFVLNYSTRSGRERRYTIGSYPDWTVVAAREEAKRLKREIDQGHDPLAELQTIRTAPTVADLCARYLEERAPALRPHTQVNIRSMISKDILPTMKHIKVAEVTFTDIDGLHSKMTRGTGGRKAVPHLANRVLSLLSSLFAEAVRWGWIKENPVKGIRRNVETKRVRYLKPEELVQLTEALAQHPDKQAVTIIRLLLLTGARRTEVLSATWRQFDLEAEVWTKPAATTKQRKDHIIPLSAPARQLLQELRATSDGDGYLFPQGNGYRKTLTRPWREIRRMTGLRDLRVHDLRHSYASWLASAGHSLPLIGALLGHSNPATTQRYAHLFDDATRKATESVGAIVTGAPSADVVPLKRGGGR